jgi:diguanylate cyclase (GGDEF)-like protein
MAHTDTPVALAPEPTRPKLLVVDDQPINIQVLYRAFSGEYQIFMATSGEQALAMCADNPPDLVLLDVMMPGMDGYEVCTRLKASEATRDIPVIFVTAHNGADDETRGLATGAVDFISKPINPQVVRARVKTHITLKFQSDLLRRMAFIDGLTGVCNRRHFDERLEAEWRRAQRNGSALSLALIDIDFFKRYNDHYGHQAGDTCLIRVAHALRDRLHRPGDMAARYGGEEFVCLLPETSAQGAEAFALQLVQAISALQAPHAQSDVGPLLSISVGMATAEPLAPETPGAPERDASALLALADAQLYTAKRTGRARACSAVL